MRLPSLFRREHLIYLIIVVLVIIKIPYLTLPFYWDEAWSYAPAVYDMHDKRFALMPGTADPQLTRGHPLLFYFVSATWMNVFGSTLLSVHFLCLLISAVTLLALYSLCLFLFGFETAIIATLFMAAQAMFMAQSTLLLPEMFLALLTLLSVLTYFKKHWGWFALFASATVMTKETGFVLIAMFIFDRTFLALFFCDAKQKVGKVFFVEMGWILIPCLVFSGFLVIQKLRHGWFFFPRHMGMININIHHVWRSFITYSWKLVAQNGRVLLLAAIVAGGLSIVCQKRFVSKQDLHRLLFFAFFALGYMLFCSINFFTDRYLLSVLPFYLMTGAFFVFKLFGNNKVVTSAAVICMLSVFSWKTILTYSGESDVSLGLINTVKLHKSVVNYCEKNNWQDRKLFAGFLMVHYLSNPTLGYLVEPANPFRNVSYSRQNCEYLIFYSNEYDPERESVKRDSRYELVRKFEQGGAWAEIYRDQTL
jgi:hypothetical protein